MCTHTPQTEVGEKLQSAYSDLRQYNADKAKGAALEACKEAYQEVEERVQEGSYGSVQAYEADRVKIRAGLMDALPGKRQNCVFAKPKVARNKTGEWQESSLDQQFCFSAVFTAIKPILYVWQ